ncbi:MAG: peptidoglycan-binding protein, partial [Gemmatimonadetes bacterium]|nr:peptidoglycan-binding protein [Gemmatimonadota bacterium]
TYKWVEERVMVKPESKELRVVPAVYQTASEQVLDQPAHTVWKKGRGLIEKVGNTTGEIMCLVEVPASYKTVTKRTLKTPARTEAVSIPAEYKTVKKQVIATPPTTRKVVIPAEYKTIPVRKMVSPPQERAVEIPAEYQTLTKRVKVSGERLEWRSVLCETNMSTGKIMEIQRALDKAGFDPGPIDGQLGSKSAAAISAYQRKNGLATGGITMKTLQSLGVAAK